MKKVVLFNVLIALILTGCSKSTDEQGVSDDGRMRIVMSLGMPKPEVNVRGSGSVGGTDGKWNGQNLRILAFRKGKISSEASDITEIGPTGIIATARENATSSGLMWANDITLYYPIQNAYDFYGYYIDDIPDNGVTLIPDTEDTPGEIVVPVQIDGTQDLMVAKAELTDAQKALLDGNLTTDEEKEAEYAKAYSSYTARRGVQPNMLFKHLLSRLTFEVKAGENKILSSGLDGVYITSIELIGVESKGNIRISAAKQELEITPTSPEELVNLSLGIKNPVDIGGFTFDGVKPTSEVDFVPMGESIMTMPGQTAFEVIIKMRQIKGGVLITKKNESTGVVESEFPFKTQIKAPVVKDKETGDLISDFFVTGYSYRVKLTMYGLEEINITAELAPWKQGDDIELSPWE